MPPGWSTAVAWCALGVVFACAGWILVDMYARGHRRSMGVMEAVWPVTALYLGPAAVCGYRRFGRVRPPRWQERHGEPPDPPGWATTATGVSQCVS